MDISNFLTEIEAGHHDQHLARLQIAVLDRLQQRNCAAQVPSNTHVNINVGQRVRINQLAATSYLRGQLGTIVEKRRIRVVVALDHGAQGRFHSGRVVVPITLLENA